MDKSTDPFIVVGEEDFNIVSLIETDGTFHNEMGVEKALSRADEEGLDLVCFGGRKSDNPLCKMIDYGKWKYSQDKKRKKMQKEQKYSEKEVRFTPLISDHDIDHKVKHIQQHIDHDCDVTISMRLKSRQDRDAAKLKLEAIVDKCLGFSDVTSRKNTNNAFMVRVSKKKEK